MPFTNTPVNDTYSSHQIPLITDLAFIPGNNTTSGLYSGMTNIVPYKKDNVEYAETRNGLGLVPVATGSNLTLRGSFVWEKAIGLPYYFTVVSDGVNTTVYTSTDTVTWSTVNAWASALRTPVRFSEFISATSVKSLVLVDGVRGYVYTTNASGTQITDADFPTPHVPFPVFLNGRLYLAKAGTGDIYNSALDDPSIGLLVTSSVLKCTLMIFKYC
jgi:hypothetical protein